MYRAERGRDARDAERGRISAEVAILALNSQRYAAWRAKYLPHIPENEDPGLVRVLAALAKWIEEGCPDG